MSSDESISAFLATLEKERADHEKSIKEHRQAIAELDALIPGIKSRISNHKTLGIDSSENLAFIATYQRLSLRLAMLKFLAQSGPHKTSEIAAALKAGGVESSAEDFASNCSATLSVMRSDRGEVERTDDDKWKITDKGLEVAKKNNLS